MKPSADDAPSSRPSAPSTRRSGAWSAIAFVVQRPVTTTMVTVALLLFGLVSTSRMAVDLLPKMAYPNLTVRTEYKGAAPEEVEELITRAVEERVGAVPGLLRSHSVSREGLSEVVLDFAWGTSIDRALADLRERLDRVRLPRAATNPVVLRYDPSQDPIVRLALYREDGRNDEATRIALRHHADKILKRQLEKIDGVAAVQLLGGDQEEVAIEVDPERLSAYKLSTDEVASAIRSDQINRPGGSVRDGKQHYLVRTVHEARQLQAFDDIVVREQEGSILPLHEIAEIEQKAIERKEVALLNGREAIELSIYREGDANTVAVAQKLRAAVEHWEGPPGLKLTLLSDRARFIESAIQEVIQNTVLGGLLAVLVLLFFLRNALSTAIIALAIPLSLLISFVALHLFGVSLNLMSLGGLALGVGMLVDNAIVTLEAVARHREEHPEAGRRQSAISGTASVASSVAASTLTTIAVFFPMSFVEGVAGQLVRDLSLAVSFSILSSMFVSLTLVPVLLALGSDTTELQDDSLPDVRARLWSPLAWIFGLPPLVARPIRGLYRALARVAMTLSAPLQRAYEGLERRYGPLLSFTLRFRGTLLVGALVLTVFSLTTGSQLSRSLLPDLGQEEVNYRFRFSPGTTIEYSHARIRRLMQPLAEREGVDVAFARIGRISQPGSASGSLEGTHLAQIDLRFSLEVDDARREALAQEILAELETQLKDEKVAIKLGKPSLYAFQNAVELRIFSDDLERSQRFLDALAPELQSLDQVQQLIPDEAGGRPEVRVHFERERLARIGVNVDQISSRIQRALQGESVGRFRLPDRQLDVYLRLDPKVRQQRERLGQLQIGVTSSGPLRLDAVAQLEAGIGPSEVLHEDGRRVRNLGIQIDSDHLGEALPTIQAKIQRLQENPDFGGVRGPEVEIAGQAEEMQRSLRSLFLITGLSLFLVYVVMASSFESLHHPFLIMFTVPMAGAGVVLACLFFGLPISAMVGIGGIILGGLAVNNAIVLIHAINQRRGQGEALMAAIEGAAAHRLRPILMTTATTVLGLLPMALGFGDGAALRRPLAISVIGGLLFSTPLTLWVIPAAYALLPGKRRQAWSNDAEPSPDVDAH